MDVCMDMLTCTHTDTCVLRQDRLRHTHTSTYEQIQADMHTHQWMQRYMLTGTHTDIGMHIHTCMPHTGTQTHLQTQPHSHTGTQTQTYTCTRRTHTHAQVPTSPHAARPLVQEEELLMSATAVPSFLLQPPGLQRMPEAPSLQASLGRKKNTWLVATSLPKPGCLCSSA